MGKSIEIVEEEKYKKEIFIVFMLNFLFNIILKKRFNRKGRVLLILEFVRNENEKWFVD